jgi:hypothetical protein
MVENLRKAEFDTAQPVRNKETGKIDYIVMVADHKRAESAPGVIALEPHIHQLHILPSLYSIIALITALQVLLALFTSGAV